MNMMVYLQVNQWMYQLSLHSTVGFNNYWVLWNQNQTDHWLANHSRHTRSNERVRTWMKYMCLAPCAGKCMQAICHWFWFYFWLVDEMAQYFLARHSIELQKQRNRKINFDAELKTALSCFFSHTSCLTLLTLISNYNFSFLVPIHLL